MPAKEVGIVKPTDRTDEESSARSDGGVVDGQRSEAPFELVSSGTMTRGDRYRLLATEWIVAPAKIVWADWRARVGGLILLGYLLVGLIAIVSRNTAFTIVAEPHAGEGERLTGAFQNLSYPLGTDNLGRDIFAQIVHSTPAMLEMVIAGALFTTVLAMIIGTLSGYKGGVTDRLLMTFTDVFMTIPGLPLVIVVAVVLEPRSPWVVGIIVVINAWAGLARAVRSQVLTLREESFVEASRLMGISTPTILAKDITPGLMPYITVNFVNTGREVIFASVGLYFIGILPRTDIQNWGLMMQTAYETGGALYTFATAHWLLSPMVAIVLFSFGLILFAQGTDRIFNPRVRARHVTPHEDAAEEETDDEMTTHLQGHN